MTHPTTEICGTCETGGIMDPMLTSGPNEADWIIQVDESLNRKTANDQRHWNKQSIYRVRTCISHLNPKAYQPQLVSFGPYHHDVDHLLPMEEHKRRALFHFLERSGKPLQLFLESLGKVAQDLEESYDALDPKWKVGSSKGAAARFLELMVTDGCFMLEILRIGTQKDTEVENDYEADDPIFSNHGKLHIMSYIRRDMLMLENQLPMLVLERLVAVQRNGEKDDGYINTLIFNFWSPEALPKGIGKCLHVLDVYRKSVLLRDGKDQPKPPKVRRRDSEEIIRSATYLHEHGVEFQKSSGLRDISFANGVLKLPMIMVDDTTESVYLNLIAFEHSHVGAGDAVTSYIFLMDNIIDTESDVALLYAKGIIQNATGSDKTVAQLFNSLSKEVTLEPDSSLDAVHSEVSKYCRSRWNTDMAKLKYTYFGSPWSIISFVAAIILFGLTSLQTIFNPPFKYK